MVIRLARDTDVPGILEIYRPYILQTTASFEYEVPAEAAFAERFREITSRGPWLVCQEGEVLLGYAYLDRAFERAAYRWAADLSIYLRMDARRQGLGRLLYTLLERMAALQGYQLLYGLVTSGNEASCRFHEAMGYRQTAVLPDCGYKMGRWYGVIWYEKRLCPPLPPLQPPVPAPQMDWSGLSLSDLETEWEIVL